MQSFSGADHFWRTQKYSLEDLDQILICADLVWVVDIGLWSK